MTKQVEIIILLVMSTFFYNCISKKTNEEINMEGIEQLLNVNLLYATTFNLPSGLELTNEKKLKITVDSLFQGTKLIIRFDYSCCEKCILSELKNIHEIFGIQHVDNIIGIVSYETARHMMVIKQQYKIEFPLYFLSQEISEHVFPTALNDLHYPYLFLVDKNLTAFRTFIPSSTFPEISLVYYKYINNILNPNVRPEHYNPFTINMIDAGKLKINAEYQYQFEYINKSNQPIILKDIKTTCGCTVPYWKKEPLLPGKASTLTIKFKPETTGFHAKKIFVYMNENNIPIPLMIKAIVSE